MIYHNLEKHFFLFFIIIFCTSILSGLDAFQHLTRPSSSTTLLQRLCAQQEWPRRELRGETTRAVPRPSTTAGTAPQVIPKPRNRDTEISQHTGSGTQESQVLLQTPQVAFLPQVQGQS